MSQLHQLIDILRGRTGLNVHDTPDAWIIAIPKAAGEICRITIPRERFEWFADVQRDGKEAWSDSMEHYGSPTPTLDAEMASSISSFIDHVTTQPLKLPLEIHKE